MLGYILMQNRLHFFACFFLFGYNHACKEALKTVSDQDRLRAWKISQGLAVCTSQLSVLSEDHCSGQNWKLLANTDIQEKLDSNTEPTWFGHCWMQQNHTGRWFLPQGEPHNRHHFIFQCNFYPVVYIKGGDPLMWCNIFLSTKHSMAFCSNFRASLK